jgi:hypothetical protein
MKDGTLTILYIKETHGLMTSIIRAWVMLTLLTHEGREYGGILWLRQGILCFVTEVIMGDSRFTDRTHRCTYTPSHSWHLVCARNHSGDFVSRRCARDRGASFDG